MIELTEEIEQKLITIGCELSIIESIARVILVCFDDEDNLKKWDIEIIFKVLKEKLTQAKNDFIDIENIFNI